MGNLSRQMGTIYLSVSLFNANVDLVIIVMVLNHIAVLFVDWQSQLVIIELVRNYFTDCYVRRITYIDLRP